MKNKFKWQVAIDGKITALNNSELLNSILSLSLETVDGYFTNREWYEYGVMLEELESRLKACKFLKEEDTLANDN